MSKRKAISKRVRFSVFSRDGFACKYCGRQSDQVRLVIDHVTPVCDGGTNDEPNLITACEECNQGKAHIPIQSAAEIESHRLSLAQEFQEQRALSIAAAEAVANEQEFRQETCNLYCEIMGVKEIRTEYLNHYVSIGRRFGVELLAQWLNIASTRGLYQNERKICMYVHGIKRNHVQRMEEESNATKIP